MNVKPIIQLDHAYLGYRGDSRAALHDVTLSLYPGDRVAVIGPNGAGKSTLFKTIVGLIPPLKGTVMIHGGSHCHKNCVSYIPQREEIDWNYPIVVRDVVMMGRYGKIPFFKHPGSEDLRIVNEAMERMGIKDLADRKIRDCSGGQQQRIFLARSLAIQPHVLLMDEPFNGVDLSTEEIILQNLKLFQEKGTTSLISTHDLNLVKEHFEKTLLINTRVIAFGPTDEVMSDQNLMTAFGRLL